MTLLLIPIEIGGITHRSGAGELCDDYDGRLLQIEAAGILPKCWNQGLLMP